MENLYFMTRYFLRMSYSPGLQTDKVVRHGQFLATKDDGKVLIIFMIVCLIIIIS